MLARCVFVGNFLVGAVMVAVAWNHLDAGRLAIDGWADMAAGAILSGCVALAIEVWRGRRRPSWARQSTPFLLIRSSLVHVLYLVLAVELSRAIISMHAAYPTDGLGFGPLTAMLLRLLRSPLVSFPSALAATVPPALLIGLANGLLLAAGERQVSARVRHSAKVVTALALLVLPLAGAQWAHAWQVKTRSLDAVRRVLRDLPVPADSTLVYREYEGCIPCRDARATVLYATDLSPEEVCDAYWRRFTGPEWKTGSEGCRLGYAAGGVDSATLEASFFPSRFSPGVGVTLTAYASRRPGPHATGLSSYGEGAIAEARAAGATFYSIAVLWIADRDAHEQRCPADGVRACSASNTWFVAGSGTTR
jgi:hypothetical protein